MSNIRFHLRVPLYISGNVQRDHQGAAIKFYQYTYLLLSVFFDQFWDKKDRQEKRMPLKDEWGHDPSVQSMRRVFSYMEQASKNY